MCIRDSFQTSRRFNVDIQPQLVMLQKTLLNIEGLGRQLDPVSYTHLRAHETVLDLVCRLLLEKKKKQKQNSTRGSNTRIIDNSGATVTPTSDGE